MDEQELLYSFGSITIAVSLFITIMVFSELGFHVGRFVQSRTDDEIKSLTGSVQASILGLLALLLSFTFSNSMQRYDSRSLALIDEANVIHTAILRIQLLPEQYQEEAMSLFQEYVDIRITLGKIDLTKQVERNKYNKQTSDIQNKLWSLAIEATKDDPRSVTTGVFAKSLNDVIDKQGRRNALQQMHVPEVVLLLLFVVFISSGGILGYSSGLGGRRIIAPVVLVSLLITLIVLIIIDLDRPKRGLIQVKQTSMSEIFYTEPK